MTRGRRPDAGLEPSRQLLTQRAFRQRRAAHLAELEEKVSRLERENAALKGIEYTEEGSQVGRKRVKAERGESIDDVLMDAGELESSQDVDNEETFCEMCALHDKERQELAQAVAVVDSVLLTLSESMQSLRQKVHHPHPVVSPRESKHPAFYTSSIHPALRGSKSQHNHSYSGSSSSVDSVHSGAMPSYSSTSATLNSLRPMPTPPDNSLLKRPSFDDQSRTPSQPVPSSISNQAQSQRSRQSSTIAAATASARSAASTYATTCTPSAGDCCSKQSSSASMEARPPIIHQAQQQLRPLQQQQQHYHSLSSHQPSAHHHAPALAVSRQRNQAHAHAHSKSEAAPGLAHLDVDESKCCLGLFECDSQGNFLAT